MKDVQRHPYLEIVFIDKGPGPEIVPYSLRKVSIWRLWSQTEGGEDVNVRDVGRLNAGEPAHR